MTDLQNMKLKKKSSLSLLHKIGGKGYGV